MVPGPGAVRDQLAMRVAAGVRDAPCLRAWSVRNLKARLPSWRASCLTSLHPTIGPDKQLALRALSCSAPRAPRHRLPAPGRAGWTRRSPGTEAEPRAAGYPRTPGLTAGNGRSPWLGRVTAVVIIPSMPEAAAPGCRYRPVPCVLEGTRNTASSPGDGCERPASAPLPVRTGMPALAPRG